MGKNTYRFLQRLLIPKNKKNGRTAVQNFKNWWNATPPASSFTVPSSNQIPGTVADVVLGQTEKYLGGQTIPSPWGPSSRGTVRGTPWATQPKYAKEIRTASKGAAVISVATLSLDLANTWTSNNGNTNGDRVLKSVVQITSTAAGVLVGVAAAAFSACVAIPGLNIVAFSAVTVVGTIVIDATSNYYYNKVGIE